MLKLGDAFAGMEDWTMVEDAIAKAYGVEATHTVENFEHWGDLYLRMAKFEQGRSTEAKREAIGKAVEIYRRGLVEFPNRYSLLDGLGNAYRLNAKWGQLIWTLKETVRITGGYTAKISKLKHLGERYIKHQRNQEQAFSAYMKVIPALEGELGMLSKIWHDAKVWKSLTEVRDYFVGLLDSDDPMFQNVSERVLDRLAKRYFIDPSGFRTFQIGIYKILSVKARDAEIRENAEGWVAGDAAVRAQWGKAPAKQKKNGLVSQRAADGFKKTIDNLFKSKPTTYISPATNEFWRKAYELPKSIKELPKASEFERTSLIRSWDRTKKEHLRITNRRFWDGWGL